MGISGDSSKPEREIGATESLLASIEISLSTYMERIRQVTGGLGVKADAIHGELSATPNTCSSEQPSDYAASKLDFFQSQLDGAITELEVQAARL